MIAASIIIVIKSNKITLFAGDKGGVVIIARFAPSAATKGGVFAKINGGDGVARISRLDLSAGRNC